MGTLTGLVRPGRGQCSTVWMRNQQGTAGTVPKTTRYCKWTNPYGTDLVRRGRAWTTLRGLVEALSTSYGSLQFIAEDERMRWQGFDAA